jgi:tRNA-modifying protein YgfZ
LQGVAGLHGPREITVLIHYGSKMKLTHKDRMIPGRDNPPMQTTLNLLLPVTAVLNRPALTPDGQPAGPLGILRAQGADAVKFLQGQLTQDVALLGLSEARLAAWCSAKGRMLASFVVFKISHDDIVLICSRSVLPTTLKRLQMFVLRAQCKLTDASGDFVLLGLTGQAVELSIRNTTQNATNTIAEKDHTAWTTTRNGSEIRVFLPPGHHAGQSVPRMLQMLPAAAYASPSASAEHLANALAMWQYLEVTSGIAPITAAVADLYVPQMLNYESVGGVNFKKGCYPGQEVVARSQFRGTLKRRAYTVSSAAPLVAGQEVFDSRDTEQPCGTVAYAAAIPAGLGNAQAAYAAIVSMQTSAADSPRLYAAASADGVQTEAALHPQALPYPLLQDI